MLQTFLPLFLMTFGICLFIVLMQFLWRYIDDMVGKGLGLAVLAEMFMYAALSLVPMALPLAVLLASLMTFGNLGERLELLSMKAAGISLIHIMRPLIILLGFISVGAFFFQNNAMPIVQVKLYTLLYSIRQKSPELDIPEGSFYKEIPGYNVYVKDKDNQTGLLKDMMIYDYSEGFNNARVILADSGRMKTSADKLFLILSLFNGESFENLQSQANSNKKNQTAVPYRRETFITKDILIEFDANFNRSDESFMQNRYMGKNLHDLQTSIDSMGVRLDSMKHANARSIYNASYVQTLRLAAKDQIREVEKAAAKEKADKAKAKLEEKKAKAAEVNAEEVVVEEEEEEEETDEIDEDAPQSRQEEEEMLEKIPVLAAVPDAITVDFDSTFQVQKLTSRASILNQAKSMVDHVKSDYFFRATAIGDEAYKVRRHLTEWHKKFTVSFACLMFFFIGAPLGAIIRKGGLGVPVVISVILFIFYYIIDNMGFKMARDGVWEAWQGMWLSSAVLTPMGIFLTYKAAKDSVILNADTYLNALKNLIGKREGRKVERKEVIIFTPDYDAILPRLENLAKKSGAYVTELRRWINYVSFWKQGGKDIVAEGLSEETEAIVEELSNSDNNLLLNKLMDYPYIGDYNNKMSQYISPKLAIAIGIFLPFGIPVYLLATYQRKLLWQDIGTVQKTSKELINMIYSLHLSDNNPTTDTNNQSV